MKTPEKIYIEDPIVEGQSIFFGYPAQVDGEIIEYIRSDIAKAEAEKMAKEFKCWINPNYLGIMIFTFDGIDDLFKEFLTSRKK